MAEPISASMILSGLLLGTGFAISGAVVGEGINLIKGGIYKLQHPNPELERAKELQEVMKQLDTFDKPIRENN